MCLIYNAFCRYLVDTGLFFMIVIHESLVCPGKINFTLYIRKSSGSSAFFGFPEYCAYLNLFQQLLYDFEMYLFTLERIEGQHNYYSSTATATNHSNVQQIQIKLGWALFVTYTIIQSIMRSEMCSLHLTHPSVHLEQWAADCAAPGDFLSEPGFEPTTLGYLGFQVQRSSH